MCTDYKDWVILLCKELTFMNPCIMIWLRK